MYLGGVNMLTEEASSFGVTRRVGVVEAQTFNTAGMIRAPGARDGSVRMSTFVADSTTVFNLPGSEQGLIVVKAAGATTANCYVARVPVASVTTDIAINEFRKYEIADSPTNGLPGLGAKLHDSIGSAISAAEDGAEFGLGAAAVGQELLMRVEVIAFTGTNALFQVEHDTTGFASPTDAFSADLTMTGIGQGGLFTVVGTAIADTFWRSSITGTFSNLEAIVGFAVT